MWRNNLIRQQALDELGSRVSDDHRALFRAHYHRPERAATAVQLADTAGLSGGWPVVNLLYGKLGHTVCDVLGITPTVRHDDTPRWWSVWSRGWNTPGGFIWQMHPEVATALEQLGWVKPSAEMTYPDEVSDTTPLIEGAVTRVTVNAYERNTEARRQCIAEHGTACWVCGFDFGAVYGPTAEGYIHVHHLRPLSEIGERYVVNPVSDLRPVCPNCHAVIHLGGGCQTVEDVRRLLRTRGK